LVINTIAKCFLIFQKTLHKELSQKAINEKVPYKL